MHRRRTLIIVKASQLNAARTIMKQVAGISAGQGTFAAAYDGPGNTHFYVACVALPLKSLGEFRRALAKGSGAKRAGITTHVHQGKSELHRQNLHACKVRKIAVPKAAVRILTLRAK